MAGPPFPFGNVPGAEPDVMRTDAATGPGPSLDRSAVAYSLALFHAKQGKLKEAESEYREALRLQPSSARAKWNLELAERRQPPPPPSGGGGGPKPPSGGGGQPSPEPSRPQPQSQGLSQNQAEQILNSMERRERQTRAEQQRRLRGGSAGGVKDW